MVEHTPAPSFEEGHPLQAWVTNLDASPYLGRLALCRVMNGTLAKGQSVALSRVDGPIQRVKLTELYLTHALTRVPADAAGPGDLVAVVRGYHRLLTHRRELRLAGHANPRDPLWYLDARHGRRVPWAAWHPSFPRASAPMHSVRSPRGSTRRARLRNRRPPR